MYLITYHHMLLGMIIGTLSKIWTSSQYVRYTMHFLFLINILAFAEAIRTITQVESKLDGHLLGGPCRDLELKVKLFVNQRNSYISGFNVFLSLVFYRLFVTMKQVHEWRKNLKEKEETEQEDQNQQAAKKKDN
jgi:hypothetical protein